MTKYGHFMDAKTEAEFGEINYSAASFFFFSERKR